MLLSLLLKITLSDYIYSNQNSISIFISSPTAETLIQLDNCTNITISTGFTPRTSTMITLVARNSEITIDGSYDIHFNSTYIENTIINKNNVCYSDKQFYSGTTDPNYFSYWNNGEKYYNSYCICFYTGDVPEGTQNLVMTEESVKIITSSSSIKFICQSCISTLYAKSINLFCTRNGNAGVYGEANSEGCTIQLLGGAKLYCSNKSNTENFITILAENLGNYIYYFSGPFHFYAKGNKYPLYLVIHTAEKIYLEQNSSTVYYIQSAGTFNLANWKYSKNSIIKIDSNEIKLYSSSLEVNEDFPPEYYDDVVIQSQNSIIYYIDSPISEGSFYTVNGYPLTTKLDYANYNNYLSNIMLKSSYSTQRIEFDLGELYTNSRGFITNTAIDTFNINGITMLISGSHSFFVTNPKDQFKDNWYTSYSSGNFITLKISDYPASHEVLLCMSEDSSKCPSNYDVISTSASLNGYVKNSTEKFSLIMYDAPLTSETFVLSSDNSKPEYIFKSETGYVISLNVKISYLTQLTLKNINLNNNNNNMIFYSPCAIFLDGNCQITEADCLENLLSIKKISSTISTAFYYTGTIIPKSVTTNIVFDLDSLTLDTINARFATFNVKSLSLANVLYKPQTFNPSEEAIYIYNLSKTPSSEIQYEFSPVMPNVTVTFTNKKGSINFKSTTEYLSLKISNADVKFPESLSAIQLSLEKTTVLSASNTTLVANQKNKHYIWESDIDIKFKSVLFQTEISKASIKHVSFSSGSIDCISLLMYSIRDGTLSSFSGTDVSLNDTVITIDSISMSSNGGINLLQNSILTVTSTINCKYIFLDDESIMNGAASISSQKMTIKKAAVEMESTNINISELLLSTTDAIMNCPNAIIYAETINQNGKSLECKELICSKTISLLAGSTTTNKIESCIIITSSKVKCKNLKVESLYINSGSSFTDMPTVEFLSSATEILIDATGNPGISLEILRLNTNSANLKYINIYAINDPIIKVNKFKLTSCTFPESIRISQYTSNSEFSLLSSSLIEFKWVESSIFSTPKMILNNVLLDLNDSNATINEFNFVNSMITNGNIIASITSESSYSTHYSFVSDKEIDVPFTSITATDVKITFMNLNLPEKCLINIHNMELINTKYSGTINLLGGIIESNMKTCQTLKGKSSSQIALHLINVKLETTYEFSINSLVLENSLLTNPNTIPLSVTSDFKSLTYAMEMPDGFKFTLDCSETASFKSVPANKSSNMLITWDNDNLQWVTLMFKTTQSININLYYVTKLEMYQNGYQDYLLNIPIVKVPRYSIDLVMNDYQFTQKKNFPFKCTIKTITINSGHYPFDISSATGLYGNSNKAIKAYALKANSDIICNGKWEFTKISINNYVNFKKLSSGKSTCISADELSFVNGSFLSNFIVYIKKFIINNSGNLLNISDNIKFEKFYIPYGISPFPTITYKGNISVGYSMEESETNVLVGEVENCFQMLEYFIPEPEEVYYNGSNILLRSACEKENLFFFIPNQHSNKKIVVLTWTQTIGLIIGFSIAIALIIASLVLIAYCRMKRESLESSSF